MPSPIETLIDQSAQTSRFASNSRYQAIPLGTVTTADGREIRYVLRRFIPPSPVSPEDPTHLVTEHERPDHLAHELIGDAERYWELCDHNLVRHPWELVAEPGGVVRYPGDGNVSSTGFYSL